MAYEIERGEMGFDILADNRTCVHSIGYGTREAARAAIREQEKVDRELEQARAQLHKLCDGLELDGLPRAQVIRLLLWELSFRSGPKDA